MLLFIVNQAGALDTSLGFQNISCYCLSGNDDSLKSKIVISKHLMLLFIENRHLKDERDEHFKTSHVIVYPFFHLTLEDSFLNFKTSHVIVYPSHFRVF